MASTTLWAEFESLWVQLNAPGADNVGPKVLDAVRKLRSRHDSDQELYQQQQLKLEERQKQALMLQRERLEHGNNKLKDELRKGAARRADLQQTLLHHEDEARVGEEQAQSVRLELREARAEVANLQNRLKVVADEMKNMKSGHEDRWSKLAQEREGISSELNNQSDALASERAAAEQGRSALEQRDIEIDATRQELGAQQSELERLNKARQAAIDAKGRSSQTAETQVQINMVKDKLKETHAAQEALNTGIEQRRASLNAAATRRKILEETQTAAVTSLSEAAANAQASTRAKEELIRLGDQISQTRSSLTQQQHMVTAEGRQFTELKIQQNRQIGELQATLKFLEDDCEDSARQAHMLQEFKRSSQPTTTTDASKLVAEETMARERISVLEKHTLDIKKQIPGLEAQLNSTQEILQNRLSKVAGLKFRATDAEENLNTIRSQIARAKEQGVRLQRRLELHESSTQGALVVSQHAEIAAASSIQQQKQKEAMLQQTLNSLAERAKDVSDNVSEGNRTLAQLRQKDKGWVSEPRRMSSYQPASRAPQESIPECASDCPPEAYRKPTPPPAGASGRGLMSRIDALAMSVSSIAAENDQLEQRIRSPSPTSSLNREHSHTFPTKTSGTLSTTPPSTEGGYKDSMSSPRNAGGRDHDQERRMPYEQYQTSSRRIASPSGRQRSPSPGFGGGGYRTHAFEQQHTIPELSDRMAPAPRGRTQR